MRITYSIDSATDQEARDLILSYQRMRVRLGEKVGDWPEPTVRIMGIGWNVTLPPLRPGPAGLVEDEWRTMREQEA